MPAWLPLKSKRLASSFWAALTAFSISIEFTCETMSKLGMERTLIERHCNCKRRERQAASQKEREWPKPKRTARCPSALGDLVSIIARAFDARHLPCLTLSTHAWLSRYHWTVSRMPRSKECAGVHPS